MQPEPVEPGFESSPDAYTVRLDQFTGPLDLLIHLIKQNEVNIYDIPIALITSQYLEYLELIEELNLDVAGDFIVMAATLIHIKSRTLLPRPDASQDDPDEDPRAVLVNRLLEYQKFKAAANLLHEREEWRSAQWQRPDQRVADQHQPPRRPLGERRGDDLVDGPGARLEPLPDGEHARAVVAEHGAQPLVAGHRRRQPRLEPRDVDRRADADRARHAEGLRRPELGEEPDALLGRAERPHEPTCKSGWLRIASRHSGFFRPTRLLIGLPLAALLASLTAVGTSFTGLIVMWRYPSCETAPA